MAKIYSEIGYGIEVNTAPGVWEPQIVKHMYYIDVNRNMRSLQGSGKVNDDINVSNEFSILSDPFADENFHNMKYVEYMGTKWKVTNVEVRYPRLILSVGGVYNGE